MTCKEETNPRFKFNEFKILSLLKVIAHNLKYTTIFFKSIHISSMILLSEKKVSWLMDRPIDIKLSKPYSSEMNSEFKFKELKILCL